MLVFEVFMRYVIGAPTLWAHLTARMTSGTLMIMGLAYAHVHHKHLRIDMLYRRIPIRRRMIIDVTLALLLLAPLLYLFLTCSYTWMMNSWIRHEVRIESWWYPPAGPFYTAFFLGWCLFALQCAAQFFRDFYLLVRNKPYD